jgi:hypothetical protein
MNDNEVRIRVYFYDGGMIDVMDDERGDRIICTKEINFVVEEIRRHLESRRRTICPPSRSYPANAVSLGTGKL